MPIIIFLIGSQCADPDYTLPKKFLRLKCQDDGTFKQPPRWHDCFLITTTTTTTTTTTSTTTNTTATTTTT